ncbi:Skp1 family, dimerization domain-containing protein, partial [Tribonema minus]
MASDDAKRADGAGTVTLVAMGGDTFTVDRNVISLSQVIRVMLEDDGECVATEIPLPTVRGPVLAKVVDYCVHYQTEPMTEIPRPIKYGRTVADHVQPWYAEFVDALDKETLFELILSCNYLDVKPLLDLTSAVAGLMLMNKTPDEIRATLGIEQPFAPEVERQLRDEIRWSTEPPVRS